MQNVALLIGNTVSATLTRFFAYLVVILTFTSLLPEMAANGHLEDFSEGSMIETAQFVLLVFTAGVFLFYAVRQEEARELCLLLGALATFACFREQDAFFDELSYLRWEIGILPFLLAGYYTRTRFPALKSQIEIFASSRAFAMLWAGFVVAIPFAQLVGHGPFLEALMKGSYNRDYTRIIEESGELVGYFLLLAGSIESVVELRHSVLAKYKNVCSLYPASKITQFEPALHKCHE